MKIGLLKNGNNDTNKNRQRWHYNAYRNPIGHVNAWMTRLGMQSQ